MKGPSVLLTRADILPSQAVYSRGSQYNSGREGAEGRRSKCGETGEASGAWERLPVNFPPRRSHNVQWCWRRMDKKYQAGVAPAIFVQFFWCIRLII